MLGFGGMAQGQISNVTENDQAFFLPESAESTLASQAASDFKESSELPMLIAVVNRSHSLRPNWPSLQPSAKPSPASNCRVAGTQDVSLPFVGHSERGSHRSPVTG